MLDGSGSGGSAAVAALIENQDFGLVVLGAAARSVEDPSDGKAELD